MQVLEIPLTQGKVALIDAIDYPLIRAHKWLYKAGSGNRGRAASNVYIKGGKGKFKTVYMHQLILADQTKGRTVWLDGDSLNNRRNNLQQCLNPRLQNSGRGSYSSFKGVTWTGKKWMAQIQVSGRNNYLGRYDSEVEAARAYNVAALHHFGKGAFLNEI